LGAGVATLIELFDSSVRRRDEIEAITGAPVITHIPNIKPRYTIENQID